MKKELRICRSVSPLTSSRDNFLSIPSRSVSPAYTTEENCKEKFPIQLDVYRIYRGSIISSDASHKQKVENFKRQYYERERKNNELVCTSCLEFKKEIKQLMQYQNIVNEKAIQSEKHLKQYESLLRIKDSRLNQKEESLNKDEKAILNEKQQIEREKNYLMVHKDAIMHENQSLLQKILELNLEINALKEIINKKPANNTTRERGSHVRGLIDSNKGYFGRKVENVECLDTDGLEDLSLSPIKDKLEEKEAKLKARKIKLVAREKEFSASRESIEKEFNQKRNELNEVEQELLKKHKELNQKTIEMNALQQDLIKREKEFSQQRDEMNVLQQELMKKEKDLESQILKLSEDQELVTEELQSIDELKVALKTQQEHLNHEKKILIESHSSSAKPSKKGSEYNFKVSNDRAKPNIDIFESYEPFDDLSFGRIDFSSCNDTLREADSRGNSIQEKDQEFFCNSIQERVCDSRDPFNNQILDSIPCRTTHASPDDSEIRYGSNQKLAFLEQAKFQLEKRIFDMERNSKLKDLFYQQEQEKVNSRLQQLQMVNKELEDQLSVFVKEKYDIENSYSKYEKFSLHGEDEENAEDECLDLDSRVRDMYFELKKKFSLLKDKELEINHIKSRLKKEEEAVIRSTLYLKSVHELYEDERTNFSEEKESFFSQKSALLELVAKQEEKQELLEMKEKELLDLRNQICSRERNLSSKSLNPSQFYKRQLTHF